MFGIVDFGILTTSLPDSIRRFNCNPMLPGKMWTDTPYDDTFYPRTFTGDTTRLSRRGRLALTFRSITTRPRRRSFTCVNTRLYFLCLQVFQFFSFLSTTNRACLYFFSFSRFVLLLHVFFPFFLFSTIGFQFKWNTSPYRRASIDLQKHSQGMGKRRRKWSTKMINVNSHLKRYISAFK